LWFKDVPSHDSIELVTSVDDGDDEGEPDEGDDAEGQDRVILRCSRPDLTEPPTAPPELEGWLDREWRIARSDPKPIENKNTVIDGETIVENFAIAANDSLPTKSTVGSGFSFTRSLTTCENSKAG
jgi:hypothetical protein